MALENGGKGISDTEIMAATYTALINALTSAASNITTQILVGFINNEKMDINLKRKMMPYVYTAGFLSFAGREVNRTSICETMSAAGINTEDIYLDLLSKTDVKSHVIYAYTFYYLISNGKEPNEENIAKVVEALHMPFDRPAYLEAMVMIKSNEL